MLCPASHMVCDLWITLLFYLVFGTTSLETESRNRLLVCSLLAGDPTHSSVLHKLHMGFLKMPSK